MDTPSKEASRSSSTRILGEDRLPDLAIQSYTLLMVIGPDPGRSWPLDLETTVGKGPDNDVVVPDITVSRRHAQIVRISDGYLVRDLESTNGTFLHDSRIIEAVAKPGTQIRLGTVVFEIRAHHDDIEIEPSPEQSLGQLIGVSSPMRSIFSLIEKIAPTDATILITGETGSGKGSVAREIHSRSKRHEYPFVTIDCGAISESLIESELFGHEKGAFTGATHRRIGALEACRSGTLFIDELDDLPLDVQPKLLRALDEREIRPVGSNRTVALDLRVIAATKKNLRQEVMRGRFREDLYFRLSVVTFCLPPLRERLEDIPHLAEKFLSTTGQKWHDLPQTFRETIETHTFPGNVRELRNLIDRAIYLDGCEVLDPSIFPEDARTSDDESSEFRLRPEFLSPFKVAKENLIERFEHEYLRRLLARNSRKISQAAREAKIDRKHLYTLLNKHRLLDDGP